MQQKMTPRAILALSTAGVSLFLLLCFCGYGKADAESALGPQGLGDTVASWFVRPLGAGAHVLAALGLAWGVIVYFQESTPDLVLRLAGTAAFAASAAMLAGLWNKGADTVWAGTLGSAAARALTSGVGSLLGWFVTLALLVASSAFATDWFFRSLRRAGRTPTDPRSIPTEPSHGALLDDPSDAEPREFVREESRAATAVLEVEAEERPAPEVDEEHLPRGFSAISTGERSVVRGPSGYSGVEFLPTNEDLAIPESSGPVASSRSRVAVRPLVHEAVEFEDTAMDVIAEADDEEDRESESDTHEVGFGHGLVELSDDAISFPAEEPSVETPAMETPAAPSAAPAAAPVAEPAEDEHPAPLTGIALADASLLVDEVFTMPEPFGGAFDGASGPHDGAAAATEIASSLSPSTDPIAPAPAPAAPAESPESAPRFADDVLVQAFAPVLDDDVFYVYEEPAGLAPAAPAMPEAVHEAVSAQASSSVAVLAAPLLGQEPAAMVDGGSMSAVVITEEELAQVRAALAHASPSSAPALDAAFTVAAEPAEISSSLARAEEQDSPASTAESLWLESQEVGLPLPSAGSATLAQTVEETVVEPVVAPAVEAVVEPVAETSAAPAVETTVETPVEPTVAPVAETVAEPVAAAAVETPSESAPVVAEPAPVTAAAPAPADAPEQLGLFTPAAADFSRLAGMDLDPLFHDAVNAILARGRASAVVLQRALGIGYARGLRILDQMTEAGLLGPDSPGGAREICFTRAQWDARG